MMVRLLPARPLAHLLNIGEKMALRANETSLCAALNSVSRQYLRLREACLGSEGAPCTRCLSASGSSRSSTSTRPPLRRVYDVGVYYIRFCYIILH